MGATNQCLDELKARLAQKLPTLAVELFPDKPDDYRLNHPRGALLLSYVGSRYSTSRDVFAVVQNRVMRFSVTALFRQLNGRQGVVDVLDEVRLGLVGIAPVGCKPFWLESEQYVGQNTGIWQYELVLVTESVFVQVSELNDEPVLVQVDYVEDLNA